MSNSLPSYPSASDFPESLTLTPEGYSYVFEPSPGSSYECPICLSILREPRQTKCGHRFCRDCIAHWMNNSGTRCPVDNEALTESDIFPDNCIKREILTWSVKCPNHMEGCEELTTIVEMQNHLEKCLLSLVTCPLNCPCLISRRDLETHQTTACDNRLVACPNCEESMTVISFEKHKPECPKEVVQCSYCKASILRKELGGHLQSECRNVVVPCPFHALGCKEMVPREIEGIHLSSEIPSHLKMLSTAFHTLLGSLDSSSNVFHQIRHQNGSLQRTAWQDSLVECDPDNAEIMGASNSDSDTLQRRRNQISSDESHPVAKRSISNVGEVVYNNELNDQYSAENRHLYHSMPQAFNDETAEGRQVAMNKDEAKVQLTSSKSVPSLHRSRSVNKSEPEALLLNQAGDGGRGHLSNANWGDNSLSSITEFTHNLQELCISQQRMLGRQQTIINNLCSKMSAAESRIKFLEESSSQHCGGDYYWTITDFSSCREKAVNEETTILHSPSFYSSPWGYKLCLRVNVNGTLNSQGENFVSLFIHFMQGNNDHLLNWPFNGQIVLTIVDQNPSCKDRRHASETLKARPDIAAFQKPISVRNHKGFGYTDFVSLNVLVDGTFIRNDSLIIRAQVFPSPL